MFGDDDAHTIKAIDILGHMLYQVGAAFEKSHTFVSMRALVEAEPEVYKQRQAVHAARAYWKAEQLMHEVWERRRKTLGDDDRATRSALDLLVRLRRAYTRTREQARPMVIAMVRAREAAIKWRSKW